MSKALEAVGAFAFWGALAWFIGHAVVAYTRLEAFTVFVGLLLIVVSLTAFGLKANGADVEDSDLTEWEEVE